MICIAADHNGFRLKESIKKYLVRRGINVRDITLSAKAADDYPAIAKRVAQTVKTNPGTFGILICGSGNGMVMAANRFSGIRAALAPSPQYAHKARADENANILVLPAWWLTVKAAERIVNIWLASPFSQAARHQRRIRQLDAINRG